MPTALVFDHSDHDAGTGTVAPVTARNAREPELVDLVRWSGPWPDDDPDANFKADVALYAQADPLRTLRGLSGATGIPVGALVRYVLARWASEGGSGLLELGPTMTRRLQEVCAHAEAAGADGDRLAAYHQLRQMISWLAHPLDHPEVYDGPAERVAQARALTSADEARSFYDGWAVSYDDDVYGALGFTGPTAVAEQLATLIAPTARVLDVGCGTGAVGGALAAQGFDVVDGLDLSPKMLRIAGYKGLYGQLIVADLGERLPVEDAAYDAVVSAGTFVAGHATSDTLDELIRVTRPGGYVVTTVVAEYFEAGGFREALGRLVGAGLITIVDERTVAVTADGSTNVRLVTLAR